MIECPPPKVEKEKIKQFYVAQNLGCMEMIDEMLWRTARLRELIARGVIKY